MQAATLAQLLARPAGANKYDFGHVLVLGGSPGMVGAPLLAAEAALRSGAGLVTIAAHAGVADKLEKRVKEIMTLRIPAQPDQALRLLQNFIRERRVSVIIIGPGQAADCKELDLSLLSTLKIPVVIDAGGLGALINHLPLLKEYGRHNDQLVLTPHSGEYERLTGAQLPANREQLRHIASSFAHHHHITLVLKGHHTLIAHPDGKLFENTTGNPGMATAGTGDVLSGIIAGLLAQGVPVREATEAGVYLHGLAGDLAAQTQTQPGMIASDIIRSLPAALKKGGAGAE